MNIFSCFSHLLITFTCSGVALARSEYLLVPFLTRQNNLTLTNKIQTGSEPQAVSYTMSATGSFLGAIRMWLAAEHSLLSSANM